MTRENILSNNSLQKMAVCDIYSQFVILMGTRAVYKERCRRMITTWLWYTQKQAGTSSLTQSHPGCNPISDLSLCRSAHSAIDHWQVIHLQHTQTHTYTHTQGNALSWAELADSFYLLSSGNPFHSLRKLALLEGTEREKQLPPHPFPLLAISAFLPSKAPYISTHIRTHTQPSKGYSPSVENGYSSGYLS